MSEQPAPSAVSPRNDLLSSLRPEDFALLAKQCEEFRLEAGDIIYRPGDNVDHCYFPIGPALCSFFVDLDDGYAVETVLVGREGALGGVVSQGRLPAYSRIQVLHAGRFLRIELTDLDALKRGSPAIAAAFARYADCVMAQVFQSIACNAAHTIEQRAAKWLSVAVDRTESSQVTMTQEQLAGMMGIGRSYASRVLQRFKHSGLLRTRRGGIEVLDRAALQARACSCNDKVQAHFALVMDQVYEGGR